MKNLLYAFLLLATLTLSNQKIEAKTFISDSISFENKTPGTMIIFKAGDKVNLNLNFRESDFPAGKTNIEYGVVKRIVSGNITEFEPIQTLGTQKSSDKSGSQSIEVIVPNVFENYATATYAFYVKATVDNDPDRDIFNVTDDEFRIQADTTKDLIKIEFINFLHSNGSKHGLLTGPTIYDLSKFKYKGVASSTSLEIIFKSNFDTVLNPSISFKKLRSDQSVDSFKPEPIKIKKGDNLIIIPLPNFDYKVGVYQGNILFDNKEIPSLDFQYIVGGDMVTFGNIDYATSSDSHIFNFDIYETPFDLNLDLLLNNISTSTIENKVYSTEFVFKDMKGLELYKISKDIDFSTSTYALSIPNTIKGIKTLYIKTTDKEGKVIYEGNKDLNIFENEKKMNTMYIIVLIVAIVLILMILILVILRKKGKMIKVAALALVLIGGLFAGRVVLAEDRTDQFSFGVLNGWSVPINRTIANGGYLLSREGDHYNENFVGTGKTKIRFENDIRSKQIIEGQDYKVMFQDSYPACTNEGSDFRIGFSKGSAFFAKMFSDDRDYRNNFKGYAIDSSYRDGKNLIYTFNKQQLNLGQMDPYKQNHLYIYHSRNRSSGGKVASDTYKVPLLISAKPIVPPTVIIVPPKPPESYCACKDGPGFQYICNSPDATYNTYNSEGNSLKCGYVPPPEPSVTCVPTLPTDVTEQTTTFKVLISNVPIGTTFEPRRFDQGDSNYQYLDTFTHNVNNNTYSFSVPKKNTVQRLEIKVAERSDLYMFQRLTCSIDNTNWVPPIITPPIITPPIITPPVVTPPCAPNCPPNGPTDPTDTKTPTISISKTPSVTLNKNGSCKLDWALADMPTAVSCSLSGWGVGGNVSSVGTKVLSITSGKGSETIANLQSNQRYTITCSGGTLTPAISESVICRVNPDIKEN